MKNITLSADENLIKQAQAEARLQKNTLNALFRQWLQEISRADEKGKKAAKIVPLDQAFLSDYLDLILLPRCQVMPSAAIYQNALRIQQETQYKYYDCLVVAATLESGAATLYSEDLQHDRVIGPLRIVNPFLPRP